MVDAFVGSAGFSFTVTVNDAVVLLYLSVAVGVIVALIVAVPLLPYTTLPFSTLATASLVEA